MHLLRFNTAIFISSFVIGVYAADGFEPEQIAKQLEASLTNVVTNATNYTYLSEIVKSTSGKEVEIHAIQRDIENLEKLFNDRSSIAKNMGEYAMSVQRNYSKNHSLDHTYEYFDSTESGSNQTQLESKAGFPFLVSVKESAVQTPTDVYPRTTDILNSIEWTKKLNEKFKENEDNITAWQFIGLSNGVFRFFPGRLWPEESERFDVRQRSWYIEGSSPPKDMVIILDLSGSVIGNRLLIIKSAILHLLDTLQENDFVNIIYFNENAHYLKKCWKHLVQATKRNKESLKAAVKSDSVTGKNVANVDKGFKLAFKILKESRDASQTSNCTQTIAFFTDGVEGDTVAEDVFDDYNSQKNVRVFTYLVGNENGSPFEAVKWIACTNKGYFYRIKTLSDVRPNIVKYVTVLSRSRNADPKWTPLFSDALGLGMTTSLVLPIFAENQLIGVLGSDVRLSEILSNFPEPHLGPGGYPFLITNNGLVFYHPLLQTEEVAGLKHPVSVYLSELLHHFENKDKTKQLARKMIDKESKDLSDDSVFDEFLVLAKYNKFRVVKRRLRYLYNKIKKTPFSIGIAITDYGSKVIEPSSTETSELKNAVEILKERNVKISIGRNWRYCSEQVDNWDELKEKLESDECNKSQPEGLLDQVRHDILKLGDNYSGWLPEENSLVKSVFFGTTSGLTFYKSSGNTVFDTSIKQEYFERAADSWKDKRVIFSLPNKDGEVLASKAVVGGETEPQDVLWGVVGVHMNSTELNKMLEGKCNGDTLNDKDVCYLVDENGYIVSSSKYGNQTTGQFFGEVEGNVMKDLISQNVYKKHNFTDVQATCEVSSEESSSSIRLLDPFFSLVSYAKWWTQTLALSLIQYSLYAALTGTAQVKAEDDGKFPCFKKIDLYYRDPTNPVNVHNDSLSGCVRSYNSLDVSGTNLLLVILNNSTSCKPKREVMITIGIDNYQESCYVVDHHRAFLRDVGGTCSPKKKESQECSSGKLFIPSVALCAVMQMLVLLLQRE